MSYTINNTYALGANEGSSQRTTGKMIVFHSTANLDASAKNNAAFEKRTWSSNEAYVHFIAGDGIVYSVGGVGYVAWVLVKRLTQSHRFKSKWKNPAIKLSNCASTTPRLS